MSQNKISFDQLSILAEDQSMMGDKWNVSQKGVNQAPQAMSLMDLIKNARGNEQHPNNVQAAVTPIYGTDNFTSLLGDLIVQNESLKNALLQVLQSPLVEEREQSKLHIEKMVKKIAMVGKLCESLAMDVQDFTLEKPE